MNVQKSLTIYGIDLIGDSLMQSPTLKTFKLLNPDTVLNYRCQKGSTSDIIHSHNPYIDNMLYGNQKQEGDVVLSCVRAMDFGKTHKTSMLNGFANQLNLELLSHAIVYVPTSKEIERAKKIKSEILKLSEKKKFVLISRHSASCHSHFIAHGNRPNKCFDNKYWLYFGQRLADKGIEPVAIGVPKDKEDERFRDWKWKSLYDQPLEDIAALISISNGTMSVDTGTRFLAAATGVNSLTISCALPNWLVSAKPQYKDQLSIDVNMHISTINVKKVDPILDCIF